MDRTINSRYFCFLKSLMRADHSNYDNLLYMLFSTEFIWDPRISTDSNRADEGKNIRLLYLHEYSDQEAVQVAASSDPCSVLEMMIALSIRIERDIMGMPGDDHPERWFWEMIDNLHLLPMNDSHYNNLYVCTILGNFLSRNYRPNGTGGIFPLTNPSTDQRLVPIWTQMGEYLVEKY